MFQRCVGLETYDVHVTLFVEQSQLEKVSHSKQGANTNLLFTLSMYVITHLHMCVHVEI